MRLNLVSNFQNGQITHEKHFMKLKSKVKGQTLAIST